MPTINLELFCRTAQQNLNQLAGENYPALKREPTGFLDAVNSEVNRAGFETRYAVDNLDGKKNLVIREWSIPIPHTQTVSTEQDICGEGVEEPRILDTVEITQYTGSRVMKFTDAELRKYCEAPSEVVTMRIAQHMSGVFRALNRKLIAQYLNFVGGFIGGVAAGKNLPLLKLEGGREIIVPDGEVTMLEDMADLGVGRPIVVGSGVISRYSRHANIGCCNEYGQDVGELASSYLFYRDRDVAQIADGTPENPIIVFAPGAVQLGLYNKYRGEFRKEVENQFKLTTTVDPVQGIELDTKIRYDECEEVWKMQFGVHHELFSMPTGIFSGPGPGGYNDERFGVNYTFLYNGQVLA